MGHCGMRGTSSVVQMLTLCMKSRHSSSGAQSLLQWYFPFHIPSCVYFILGSVTHPVVSQVNPHVHLFFFASRGSAGKPVANRKGKGVNLHSRFLLLVISCIGWRGNFLLSAAEQWLKLELTKNFKVSLV